MIRTSSIASLLGVSLLLTSITATVAQAQQPPADPSGAPAGATAPPQGQGGTPLQRGIAAFKVNDLATAARELSRAIEVNPDSAEAHNWYGFVLLKQGKPALAIPELERALTLKPNTADTCTNLGNALLVRPNRTPADTQRALALFETAARLTPDSAQAAFNVGYAYARAGRYDEAATAYRQAVQRNANDGKAWANLGFVLTKLGKNEEAMEALQQGTKWAPDDASTWAMLGTLKLQSGASVDAITALETARKKGSPGYSTLIDLGRAYASAGRFVEAGEAFSAGADLMDSQPNVKQDPTARYNQGVVLAKAGKLADAAAAYDKALAIDPTYYDALVNSGFVLFRQSKMDESIARFKAAVSVKPDATLAWTNLAAAYEKKGALQDAAVAWRKAIAHDPKNYVWREQLVNDLMALRKYDTAANIAKEMTALQPRSPDPYNLLGLAYQAQAEQVTLASEKQARLLDALRAFQEAARRDPKSAVAYNNQGVIHEKRGEMPEAIAAYKKALAINPAMEDARSNLARFKPAGTPKKTIKTP